MDGTFSEQDYEETELSKLETKWNRFLVSAKLSNQRLEEERKNIQELVSDISHQTKTPLANIMLYSQLLSEQNLDETSQRLVSEIVKQSEKMEFLIQSLVKTSRLETGTFQFHVKPQDILPVIMDIVEQGKSKAEKRKMQIVVNMSQLQLIIQSEAVEQEENKSNNKWQNVSTQIEHIQELETETIQKEEGKIKYIQKEKDGIKCRETESIQAVFDRKWTGEALYNILDNAIKYGEEGSRVRISVKAYEMFVCINISNIGGGIPEQEIPCIFQRFYRGENAKETEGVGIGLYLARQIVEEQSGYIKVSTKEGKEICFSVYLPRKMHI